MLDKLGIYDDEADVERITKIEDDADEEILWTCGLARKALAAREVVRCVVYEGKPLPEALQELRGILK